MNSRRIWRLFTLCCLGSLLLASLPVLAAGAQKTLVLPAIFCDNMVLQRNINAPVWGKATPGTKVTVRVCKQTKTATADQQGKWMLRLDPMPAGGPFTMTVRSGDEKISYANVMVGEVWICSGQSNMEMIVGSVKNAKQEILAANYPNIRLFTVNKAIAQEPLWNVTGNWATCTPETVKNFSAVGYFFGRDLFTKYHVPIGLINTSWGGTPAESWTSAEAMKSDVAFKPILDRFTLPSGVDPLVYQQEYNQKMAEYEAKKYVADPGNVGVTKGWAKADFDDSSWKTMSLPGMWDNLPGMNIDGAVWFRKVVDIPAAWDGKSLSLSLGAIDDFDVTYVNGTQVGAIGEETPGFWAAPRNYTIPASLVKAGKNVIAIRVFDHFGGGGLVGPAEELHLVPAGDANAKPIDLTGTWKYAIELALTPVPEPNIPALFSAAAPSSLYNAMIAPLVPYGICGAIWYQGEANAGRSYQYRKLFPAMITSWRSAWGEGDFPFLFVQLANFMPRRDVPIESGWAELREAQTMTLSLPKTGMAVIIDIGEASDIHPKNKQDVGKRLALAADAIAYGKILTYSGPMYDTMRVEGNAIRLTFTSTGKGLVAQGGNLKGFAVAGADKQFVWANARIEGNTVVVWSDSVAKPVAVRYAWADNPECNLYNVEGLPASPFRTDTWPGLTISER